MFNIIILFLSLFVLSFVNHFEYHVCATDDVVQKREKYLTVTWNLWRKPFHSKLWTEESISIFPWICYFSSEHRSTGISFINQLHWNIIESCCYFSFSRSYLKDICNSTGPFLRLRTWSIEWIYCLGMVIACTNKQFTSVIFLFCYFHWKIYVNFCLHHNLILMGWR